MTTPQQRLERALQGIPDWLRSDVSFDPASVALRAQNDAWAELFETLRALGPVKEPPYLVELTMTSAVVIERATRKQVDGYSLGHPFAEQLAHHCCKLHNEAEGWIEDEGSAS